MLLKTKGKTYLIDQPIIGIVTRDSTYSGGNSILICSERIPSISDGNFEAFLTCQHFENRIDFPSVYNILSLDHLNEGDIILVNTDGVINTLFRTESHHNFLLLTERCNSNCLMCSQPPRDKNDDYLIENHKKLIPLIPKSCEELGLTGGEPTLLGDHFFELLEVIKNELPETEIHCLTNGRSFAWHNVADRLGSLNYSKLMLGIPLYSDHSHMHDYIVQSRDAFNQTILGLYNLARYHQRVEIRVVLHQQTIGRLLKLAKFIYRNLPFVEHVVFMGLENQGYTPFNRKILWVEPTTYMDQLQEAVEYLNDMGMNVSIYNSQLCTMPNDLWKFNRRSISDWKNIYLEECKACAMKEECGGLFASCENMHSSFIKAFTEKV
jgi:His-Xaa-Ser system radical SAM maturase HxsC